MGERNRKGQFVLGNTMSNGRKPGASDRYAIYKKACRPKMPELIEKLMEMALNGDLVAAKLILDRMWIVSNQQMIDLQAEIDELKELLNQRRAA